MTPEQIDTVTDGLITTWQLVGEYGPGLAVAAVAGGCWIAARRITGWIHDRRDDRRGIRQLEHFANHPANRTRKEKP